KWFSILPECFLTASTGQPVAVTVNQHVACYPMPGNSGFVNHLFYDTTKTKTGFIADSTYCQRYHLRTRQRHRCGGNPFTGTYPCRNQSSKGQRKKPLCHQQPERTGHPERQPGSGHSLHSESYTLRGYFLRCRSG